ncbi:MAG: pseudaminic acid cytidylyltransferase [Pseudomonadota bacterium]
MKRLAVIPARGGSKRIPRKNLRAFAGRPIIAHSIQAARDSGLFDVVLVSTDDDEIAAVARAHGADVPFLRPKELADDHTGTQAVVKQAIEAVAAWHSLPEQACCIYATAPFVRPADLASGLAALESSGAEFAFSVTSFAFPIQRALRLDVDGHIGMMWPEHMATRSQDLEHAWHDAGQFYWGRAEAFLSGVPLYSKAAVGVPLPRHRVQDIDTEEDWRRAELMFQVLQAEG